MRIMDFIRQSNSEVALQYMIRVRKLEGESNAVASLLSKNARWNTGQELIVDGGWSRN